MPLAMFAATRTCVCIFTSVAAVYCCIRSSRRCPASWLRRISSSSYTTDRPTRLRPNLGLRIISARFTRRVAYSGYFMGMSIFSSSFSSSCGSSLSRNVICCADCSVTMVEMMHVNNIIITTAFSISSSTRMAPLGIFMRMPTITIAMAPAAWAEVRPNIMLPDEGGSLNSQHDR